MIARDVCWMLVFAGVSLASSAILAEDAKPAFKDPAALFAELDKNGDGNLTADEVTADQKRYFERLLRSADADKDGKLTKAEFVEGLKPDDLKVAAPPAGGGPRGGGGMFDPKQVFQRLDRDKDGKISVEEVPEQARAQVERWLRRAGKGKEGSLTLDELQKIAAENLAGMPGRPGAAAGMPLSPFFRKLDADRDGRLTKDELQKAASFFNEFDINKDGFLDPGELFGPPGGQRPAILERPAGDPPAIKPRQPNGPKEADEKSTDAATASRTDTARKGKRPAPSSPGGGNRTAGSPANGKRALERFDRDGDGRISRSEATGRLKENFDTIDLNGDGFLERSEIRSALQQLTAKK